MAPPGHAPPANVRRTASAPLDLVRQAACARPTASTGPIVLARPRADHERQTHCERATGPRADPHAPDRKCQVDRGAPGRSRSPGHTLTTSAASTVNAPPGPRADRERQADRAAQEVEEEARAGDRAGRPSMPTVPATHDSLEWLGHGGACAHSTQRTRMAGRSRSWLARDGPAAGEPGTRAPGDETMTRHEGHRRCHQGPSTSGSSDSGTLGSWDATDHVGAASPHVRPIASARAPRARPTTSARPTALRAVNRRVFESRARPNASASSGSPRPGRRGSPRPRAQLRCGLTNGRVPIANEPHGHGSAGG